MKLRDYQVAAIADVERRRLAGDTRVPIVLATGLGKTQIFASYVDQWLSQHPGQRALVLAHTDELIQQAVTRIKQIAPDRSVGVVKAGQNEVLAEIVVSSRQTLATARRREQLRFVGLIVIDECHHATATNTYGKILEHFEDKHPVFVLGVTATLARSDKAKLSSVWQDCTFVRDITFGIRNGYLLDVTGEQIIVPDLDFSNIRVRGGDYAEGDVAEELERTFAPEIIAKEYARLAGFKDPDDCPGPWSTVRRGIAFWPLVETSYHGARAFDEIGIRSGVVHGGLDKRLRRELLQRFHLPLTHSEAIDVMHNAMVLTEGFDEPTADVVVIARPTRSAPLYQQMVGRVLRPNLELPPEQRGKALILDVTGAGAKHDLRALLDLSPEAPPKDDLDDEVLIFDEELEEALGDGPITFESPAYAGPVETRAFDPLGRDKVWGRTAGGHYFINAGSGYVFLCESLAGDPGTYDVVTCSQRRTAYTDRRTGQRIEAFQRGTGHTALPLELALSWGEEVATELGGHGSKTLTGRKSTWRNGAPTAAQVGAARGWGISETDILRMSKGELSEAIDARAAANRIDPLVAQVKAMMTAEVNA
jgi:superfamily II DNA or RNA helicase